MPVIKLEHYNLLTADFAATIAFYSTLLGMRAGPAPGAGPQQAGWIYDTTGTPVVHVQAVDPDHPATKLDEVQARLGPLAGTLSLAALQGSGAIEHVAFECDGYDELAARFDASGIPTRTNDFPAARLRQIFVNDPNGVTVELNFRGG